MEAPTTWSLPAHLKQRALDLAMVWVLVGTGLGAYHLYKREVAHNQIDQTLLDILGRQDATQLAGRCAEAGYVKPEKVEDAPERPAER